MKVIIAGTGAMGATYGSMLKKSGNEVIFLDLWQENVDSINKNGINFKNIGVEENIKAEAYLPSQYNE
ncbi:2-dehydropantoate 2-reductase, partial [Acinetobacter baumannii]|nr:2-dehydropantoate 2-reductase [Acinetobacter baumannii]